MIRFRVLATISALFALAAAGCGHAYKGTAKVAGTVAGVRTINGAMASPQQIETTLQSMPPERRQAYVNQNEDAARAIATASPAEKQQIQQMVGQR